MDIGYSINPAIDIGQVCVPDLPPFPLVTARTAVGIFGENTPSHLLIALLSYSCRKVRIFLCRPATELTSLAV